MDITKLIVNYNVAFRSVLLLLVYSMPYFLIFTVPLSTMMTVLLTFIRLSADNEIIALKAGGGSIYRLLPPVCLFCLMGFLLTGFMGIWGLPWGKGAFRKLTIEIASTNIDIGLKERTFNDTFKDVMLYVHAIDMKTRTLKDIFIHDARAKNAGSTVISPKGVVDQDADKLKYTLRLFDGMINQIDLKKKTVHSITFDTYDIHLDLHQLVDTQKFAGRSKYEMSLTEMRSLLTSDVVRDKKY